MSRRGGRAKVRADAPLVEVVITALSHEGRGVARVDGKAVFIANALPGETVLMRITRRHGRHDEAIAVEIVKPSPDRVTPPCPHYGTCGGCSLQHLAPAAQVAHKQKMLLDNLAHVGQVVPAEVLAPITGPDHGYRRRARLGVRYAEKKGGTLVGFRERAGRYLADMQACAVLDPRASALIMPLRALIDVLTVRDRIPQIEVSIGDNDVALGIRHLAPCSDADVAALARFAAQHGVQIHLQPAGPDSLHAVAPPTPRPLSYQLASHQVTIDFEPTDFIQVNGLINARIVDRAVALLQPAATDEVLELFCGLGNFTLPMARQVRRIVGMEGEAGLVARAHANARRNGIDNAAFVVADLTVAVPPTGGFNKVFLDPPRTGAAEVIGRLGLEAVDRLVYVSCNPATLARDAGVLVRKHGLELVAAGIMDMFPHTAHVESIAVFVRG